ncbi:MAG: hypothetical protein ACFFD8_07165 [Candidatus Thorarchaeota archaeon]
MSKIVKKRQPFKLQIMDLLLQHGVPTEIADEVASEIIKGSNEDTPIETIRVMLLDQLRKHDVSIADKLSKRFEFCFERLEEIRLDEVGPAGEIYDDQALDDLLEADEITAAELFFMEGREGRAWQRKTEHRDTGSTELSREDYYED